jgi:hypothetical protein
LSANTVAQKPAGSFRPLSLLGHAWLSNRAPALNRLPARIKETPAQIVVSATREYERVFFIASFHFADVRLEDRHSPRRNCSSKTKGRSGRENRE